MERTPQKRRIVATAMTLLVMGVVGLVYAAWTATGTGNGYAEAGNAQALTTVDVSASTSATLYPGNDGDVLIEIDNPNPYPVRVTSVSGNGAITADTVHTTAGCVVHGVTYADQSSLTLDVPAEVSAQFTLTDAASMGNTSANACQGATFTIPVSLSGNSNAS